MFNVNDTVKIVYIRKQYAEYLKQYLNTTATIKAINDDGDRVCYELLAFDGATLYAYSGGYGQLSIVAV